MAIPISVNSQQLNFRLLELPTELAELLQSEDPPVLQLKSSEPSAQTQAPENAVLCTSDRSYEVRQVQSSNVLYILQQSTDGGFTSIAQCKGLLELLPSKDVALDYVRRALPKYSTSPSQRSLTHTDLITDAPFSQAELEASIKELCVYEKDNHLWTPDPNVLVKCWKTLFTAATINGIKLDQPWDTEQLASQVTEDKVDIEIYQAVVARLSSGSGGPTHVVFEAANTIAWLGHNILESQSNPVPKEDFIVQWQDLVPENWRALVNLDLLQGKFEIMPDGSIKAISDSTNSTDTLKTALPPKSKWHQKFRK